MTLALLTVLLVRMETSGPPRAIPLERYVGAALAGESSVFASDEALRAMAVAARTYGVRMRGRHRAEGFDLCATPHCQRLDAAAVNARIAAAADETAGELLWFEGKPAFTPYTRDCGGRAEAAAINWPDLAAPYLPGHDDPHCLPPETWRWTAAPGAILDALRAAGLRAPTRLERIEIDTRTPSGRALMLRLKGDSASVPLAASSFRFALGRAHGWHSVRSDLWEASYANGRWTFTGRGSGHGAGLCQRGADRMGAAGRGYRDILAFYYPGAVVGLSAQGLNWRRLAGESITLLSVAPDTDRPALAAAERALRRLTQQTGIPAPRGVELRVYPHLDAFRNATGEPGWVAARTSGRRIHMQPSAVLASRGALDATVAHEVLHMLLESQAAPGLPLWFREGLAGHLEGASGSAAPRRPSSAEFAGDDAATVRRARASAVAEVARLAQRYGETALLDWLRRGLPREVTNASASQPITSRK